MPELPEVESVRRGLEPLVVGKKILDYEIFWNNSVERDLKGIKNKRIKNIHRRGKYLGFKMSVGYLVIHLRMAGTIGVSTEKIEKYVTVKFKLDDGNEMRLIDYRKFGKVWFVDKFEEVVGHLGPEPLSKNFDVGVLKKMISKRRGMMKPLLLNQRFVAGLGNIYVDESLFRARIHPTEKADKIDTKRIEKLYEGIIDVLTESLNFGGTTFISFVGADGKHGEYRKKLKVFNRTGEPCIVCGTEIKKIFVCQRGTHFCPSCQKN